jgi:hypothetical protein
MNNNIRSLAYIRTPRMLKGFRSCINATGKSQMISDQGRVVLAECQRLNRVYNIETKRIIDTKRALRKGAL